MIRRVLKACCVLAWVFYGGTFVEAKPLPQGNTLPSHGSKTPSSHLGAHLNAVQATLRARLYSLYQYTSAEPQSFDEFDIREMRLMGNVRWHRLFGMWTDVEMIRTAQPQSLFGVDGDSYVMRLREAWGFVHWSRSIVTLEARFGLVPDLWLRTVGEGYKLRAVQPLLSESAGFFAVSDYGVWARLSLWQGALDLRTSFTNGEGLNRTEQNNGKNAAVLLSVRPLRWTSLKKTWDVALHFSYRDGSLGTGLAKNHRWAGALTLASRWVDLGAEYIFADGWRGRGEIQASGFGVWASGYVVRRRFGLLGRFDRWQENHAVDESYRQRLSAGMFAELLPLRLSNTGQRFRVSLLYQNDRQGGQVTPFPGVPAVNNAHRIQLLLTLQGLLTR